MIESIFRTLGERTGLIGTIGATINGKSVPLERTTPEAPDLQRLFADMVSAGVRRCVMEVSSQGITMERTAECAFDTGVFTNLTQGSSGCSRHDGSLLCRKAALVHRVSSRIS